MGKVNRCVLRYVAVVLAMAVFGSGQLLAKGLPDLLDPAINPYLPSTYFVPMPSDILPMGLTNQFVKMHNYIVTLDSKTQVLRDFDREELKSLPFVSEHLQRTASESVQNKLQKRGRIVNVNIGFQYYTRRNNWNIVFKHEEVQLDFVHPIRAGRVYFERWQTRSTGVMVGANTPLYRSYHHGQVAWVWGGGLLVNHARNGLGSELLTTYENRYMFVPLQAGLIAEWNRYRWLSLSFWSRIYYPALLFAVNEIDRQLSAVHLRWRYGIDVRGHLDISGLGIDTSLTSQVQKALSKLRLKKVAQSQEETVNWEDFVEFNLSFAIPFEWEGK